MANTHDQITQGLMTYVEKTQDQSVIGEAALLYRSVADAYLSMVQPLEVCELAFPSMIIRSDIRASAFVAIFPTRVIIAWRKGSFRKRTEHVEIQRSKITKANWHVSQKASTRGATLFEIVAGETTTFALPQGATKAADIIKQALTLADSTAS